MLQGIAIPQTGIAAPTLTAMQGFKAKKKHPHSIFQNSTHTADVPTGVEPGANCSILNVVTFRPRIFHPMSIKMSYFNQMYEKGNVSIREEKKYRECSIRQVTSNMKSNVKEIDMKVSINYDRTNLMLI